MNWRKPSKRRIRKSKSEPNNMGQAKSRGTFEERKAFAEARNQALLSEVRKNGSSVMRKIVNESGVQRLATKLAAVGAPMHE